MAVVVLSYPGLSPLSAAPVGSRTAQIERSDVQPSDLRRGARVKPTRVPAAAATLQAEKPQKPAFVHGEIAVIFEATVSAADRAALRRAYGVLHVQTDPDHLERWTLAKADDEAATAKAVGHESGVVYAGVNHLLKTTAAPNDPRFSEQWYLDQASDADIDAQDAWAASDAQATTPVTVAVVDNGVDTTHPDLANQLWRNNGEWGPDGHGGLKQNNGHDDDQDGYVDDVNGANVLAGGGPLVGTDDHGTHVAGLIAAQRANGVGIAGVSKQARIMPVRWLQDSTGNEADLRKAVVYAVDHGAQIVNGSLADETQSRSTGLLDDVIAAHPEVLFVFGAGNANFRLGGSAGRSTYPCSNPSANIICVAATDKDDTIGKNPYDPDHPPFSSYGPADVDIAAPGVGILSTIPGGGYAEETGTSMATPIVAGAAAILLSRFGLSPIAIKARLMNTADPIQAPSLSASGRLNLARAVAGTAVPTPSATATIGRVGAILSFAAGSGQKNGISVIGSGSSYEVYDSATHLLPGTGCTAITAQRVSCTGVGSILIDAGDLDDAVYADTTVPVSVDGGAGFLQFDGSNEKDIVDSGDANDIISTLGGDDTVDSGAGDDRVVAGDGDDSLVLGAGNDLANGEAGRDSLQGGDGNDILYGGMDDDIIDGGAGVDFLQGYGGKDRVYGGPGDDSLGAEESTSDVSNYVDGGSGADQIVARSGGATYVGGSGIDTLTYVNAPSAVVATIGAVTGNGVAGQNSSIAGDIEALVGSNFADTLTGSAQSDLLAGGAGNDTVNGLGGDDVLSEDDDTVGASAVFGNDTLNGGSGIDLVDYSRPNMQGAGLNGSGAITASLDGVRNDGAAGRSEQDLIATDVEGIYGGDGADTLKAGSASSILDGGKGVDTLTGGASADTIYAQDGGTDTIVCGGGSDVVRKDSVDTPNADCESTTGTPIVRIGGTVAEGAPTGETRPSFTFTASGGPGATFGCQLSLVGASVPPATACVSGWRPPAALADGNYRLVVSATVPGGSSGIAIRQFTVDTTPPDTSVTAGPAQGDIVDSENVSLTVASTESGSTFECHLDGADWESCGATTSYTELPGGSHKFYARAKDRADNFDPTPVSRTFTIGSQEPRSTIDSKPLAQSVSTSATFSFSALPAASTFECRLDSGTWSGCASPRTLTGLAAGSHTFSVRGLSNGFVESTPASYTWQVNPALPPTVSFTSPNVVDTGSVTLSSVATPVFTLTADQPGVTYQCSADGGDTWVACGSSWTSPAQVNNAFVSYSFRAKSAASAYGNTADLVLKFDLIAPTTTITGGPTPNASWPDTQADIPFTVADNRPTGVTAQCKLDGGGFTACTSPYKVTGLALGQHTVQVRAVDQAGGVDASPESLTFTVVAPFAPTASWVNGPEDWATLPPTDSAYGDPSPTFRFTANIPRPRFECAVGSTTSATFVPCASPWNAPARPEGVAVYQVRAIGPTGLVGSPIVLRYTIDTTPPDTTIVNGPAAGSTVVDQSQTFVTSRTEDGTLECKLDAATVWTPCDTVWTVSGLSDGSHTLQIRAVDQAKNADPSPATRTFTVTPGVAVGAPSSASGPVSLTNAGPVDWIHWASASSATVDRKSGSPQRLSTWTKLGTGTVAPTAIVPTFNWTNAAGTASGSSQQGVGTGATNGRGFSFTGSAVSSETRTLYVWAGVRAPAAAAVSGSLKVSFAGDTTIAPATSSVAATAGQNLDRLFIITYRPRLATDSVKVEWTQAAGGTAAGAAVVLEAAAIK